tara:strand:- start:2570 stop:2938 length:369 start_codon:yes stop_codon:yes gene_type:complete
MKWIGANVQEWTSYFRNDVYIENIETLSAAHVIGIGSNGKITKFTTPTSTSGDATYTHAQSLADHTWVINHNLGKRPSVVVILDGGGEIEGFGLTYNSTNQLTLTFESAGSPTQIEGVAYLN